MAITSDVERAEAAREALEAEAAQKIAIDAMSDTGQAPPQPRPEPITGGVVAPPPRSQSQLVDPNLGQKTNEELIQGRERLLEMMDDPPVENRDDQQMQSFQDLLIRINGELSNRGVQF